METSSSVGLNITAHNSTLPSAPPSKRSWMIDSPPPALPIPHLPGRTLRPELNPTSETSVSPSQRETLAPLWSSEPLGLPIRLPSTVVLPKAHQVCRFRCSSSTFS